MMHFPHLIVGGGMTAAAAAHAIREMAPQAAIGLIGSDPHPPYNRPPLSKALWKGDSEEGLWRTGDVEGVELMLGRRVVAIDPAGHRVTDDRGAVHGYDQLLLATGGAPRQLSPSSPDVIYFRTLDDYRRLRALAKERLRFAVIGGGFIGSEVAAALRMQSCDVTMLVPEAGIGARVFPGDLSRDLVAYYREQGVTMRMGEGLAGIETRGGKSFIRTTAGADVSADVIVAGLGIIPSVELAEQAGLRVENGIVVDEQLRTSVPGVFAAGDVANFPSAALGRPVRVEHEDNANSQGRQAGRNMAGAAEAYRHLPFFYSDLFERGYEAVGDLDARLETVADWKTPFREGVIYYVDQSRVRGVLLWNTWGQLDHARALIAEPGPFSAVTLKGRLPVA